MVKTNCKQLCFNQGKEMIMLQDKSTQKAVMKLPVSAFWHRHGNMSWEQTRSWRGLVTPKFSAPPSDETKLCVRPPKVLEVQESAVLYHHAKFGGARILPTVAKHVEFFVCLSVCSSCLWMSEFVRTILPRRRWSTETILIPLHRGRFVVVHPCSTFSDYCQLATTQNAEVQKLGVFAARAWQNKPIKTKFGT